MQQDLEFLAESVGEEELAKERRLKEHADGARILYWVGVSFIGTSLVPLINLAPVRLSDPSWQLSVISLLMANGVWALLGALLICLARLLNGSDRTLRSRALLVRNLSSWVAVGWLLFIPLQLFMSMRVINSLAGQEIAEIQNFQRISRTVRNVTTEDQLRAALAEIPNQRPLPRLNVPVEVARTNILSQFQRNIIAAKNRQEQRTSDRWQIWLKESFRNSMQCLLLALGYLAIGKKRGLA
jgi:hypothetical protein